MSDPLVLFTTALQQAGCHVTAPRRAVFNALLQHSPLTMQQLIAQTPEIDRASAYRTVSLLSRLGIIDRIQIGWKYKLELSDQYIGHHHHLACLACGRLMPFDEPAELHRLISQISSRHGFAALSHNLEISGRCARCRLAD